MRHGDAVLWTCAYCYALVDPRELGEGVYIDVHNGRRIDGQALAAHRECFTRHLDPRMSLGTVLESPETD